MAVITGNGRLSPRITRGHRARAMETQNQSDPEVARFALTPGYYLSRFQRDDAVPNCRLRIRR